MRRSPHGVTLFFLAGILAMAVTAHAQGITDMKKGEGGSAVQGSAGPSGAPGAASDLERCDKPMGAVAGPVNVLSQGPLQAEHTVEAGLVERGLHGFGELPST